LANQFYEQAREGWFWYQDPVEEEGEAAPAPVTLTTLPLEAWLDPAKYRSLLKRVPIEQEDLSRLPAGMLRELASAKREAALDAPTPETVKTYIIAQRAVFKRSEDFTTMWQVAMYTNPQLDFATEHPTSQFGHDVEAQATHEVEERLLSSARANHVGLFFFFTSTCRFCQEQSKILKLFSDTYQIEVFPVTLDGQGLKEFPKAAADNGMAERVSLQKVPTIYLAIPRENFLVPIGSGVMTFNELRERVLTILKQRPHLMTKAGDS
jgi:conjugal transfer pilus assembly protein TraF